jgi:hypothetical protein
VDYNGQTARPDEGRNDGGREAAAEKAGGSLPYTEYVDMARLLAEERSGGEAGCGFSGMDGLGESG